MDHGFRTVRCDLRGFGETGLEPGSSYSDAEDVLALLDQLGVAGLRPGRRVRRRPRRAPGRHRAQPRGSPGWCCSPLRPRWRSPTSDLRARWQEEGRLVDAGDLDAATELNVRAWVGPDADDAARGLVAADAAPAPCERPGRRRRRRRRARAGRHAGGAHDADDDPRGRPRLRLLRGDRHGRSAPCCRRRRSSSCDWAGHLPSLERPDETAALVLDALRDG